MNSPISMQYTENKSQKQEISMSKANDTHRRINSLYNNTTSNSQ